MMRRNVYVMDFSSRNKEEEEEEEEKRVYVVSFVSDPAEGSYTQIVITKDSIENYTCDWQSP